MSKKTIRLTCYGPITLGYTSYWEDVWIKYCLGKKRKISEGPCIIGLYDLESEISTYKDLVNKLPEYPDYKKKLQEVLNIKEYFLNGGKFSTLGPISSTPVICVNKEVINKRDAEEAIEWYLIKKGILKSKPRFQWKKISNDIIVIPWSL